MAWRASAWKGRRMGFFDAVTNGMRRWTVPLDPDELARLCRPHMVSDIVGRFHGRAFLPSLGRWRDAVLIVFGDGAGKVLYFGPIPSGDQRTVGELWILKEWPAGEVTNTVLDPAPLLVRSSDINASKVTSTIAAFVRDDPLGPGETLVAFQNFTNDYDSDGYSSWVSGGSDKKGTQFRGILAGKGAATLTERCKGRRSW